MQDNQNTQRANSSVSACSVTRGGPLINWKSKHDKLVEHLIALESAASILRDSHQKTSHCEHPRTCGGCHFWTGVMEACKDVKTGDKRNVAKALAVIQSQNNQHPEHLSR